MIIAGIILAIKLDSEIGAGCLVVFGAIALILSIGFWIFTPVGEKQWITAYNQNTLYLELIYNNENITETERLNAIKIIIDTNNKIINTEKLKNNFMIGIFQYRKIIEFRQLDTAMIKPVKNNIEIEKDK